MASGAVAVVVASIGDAGAVGDEVKLPQVLRRRLLERRMGILSSATALVNSHPRIYRKSQPVSLVRPFPGPL